MSATAIVFGRKVDSEQAAELRKDIITRAIAASLLPKLAENASADEQALIPTAALEIILENPETLTPSKVKEALLWVAVHHMSGLIELLHSTDHQARARAWKMLLDCGLSLPEAPKPSGPTPIRKGAFTLVAKGVPDGEFKV